MSLGGDQIKALVHSHIQIGGAVSVKSKVQGHVGRAKISVTEQSFLLGRDCL